MKKILIILTMLISYSLYAQTYSIEKSVIDNSGDISTSSTYTLTDAIAQSITGKSTSSSYIETAGILHMTFSTILAVEENILENLPLTYYLSSPFPNPCNNVSNIRFNLPITSIVSINIYDLSGRCIKYLINENVKAGFYDLNFSTVDFPSGIYFLNMYANDFTQSYKLTITK